MNFSLPVTVSQLGTKKITMKSDVTLTDCVQHLKATLQNGEIMIVNSGGYLELGGNSFNSVSCSGNEITFGSTPGGPTIKAFDWE